MEYWVASIFQPLERAEGIVPCSRLSVGWARAKENTIFALVSPHIFLPSLAPNQPRAWNRALGRKPSERSTFSQKLPCEIILPRPRSAYALALYSTREPLYRCDHLSGTKPLLPSRSCIMKRAIRIGIRDILQSRVTPLLLFSVLFPLPSDCQRYVPSA